MRPSSVVHHIRHIALQGLPPHVAIPLMVDAIELAVPSRTRTFIWLDEFGQATDVYEKEPIQKALDAFNLQTPELFALGEPCSIDLACSTADFGGWLGLTRHPNWDMSVMKNELFQPYGIGNNLDFPIRHAGVTRAVLTVCREPGSRSFTQAEIDTVLGLRPYFLHALDTQGAERLLLDAIVEERESVALIRLDGSIADAGRNANMALYMLADQAPLRPMICSRAPDCVMALVRRLHAGSGDAPQLPPSASVVTRWGRIDLAAHLFSGNAEAVVTLRRSVPRIAVRLERLRSLDLSPREREVALAMCGTNKGESVATGLGLSTGAYRQYAKRIYAKLDVQGREGVARLLDGANLSSS